jgi:hypothetical protein
MAVEAGAALQRNEEQIARLAARDKLTNVGLETNMELDRDQVVNLVDEFVCGQLRPLARYVARKIASGELNVPRPRTRTEPPRGLLHLLDAISAVQGSGLQKR